MLWSSRAPTQAWVKIITCRDLCISLNRQAPPCCPVKPFCRISAKVSYYSVFGVVLRYGPAVPPAQTHLWQMAAKTLIAIALLWMLCILLGGFLHSGVLGFCPCTSSFSMHDHIICRTFKSMGIITCAPAQAFHSVQFAILTAFDPQGCPWGVYWHKV